jgi:DNA-binding transcriptional ArsR family regulator
VIDRLRAQIEERLTELASEAERLRQALDALESRPSSGRTASAADGSARWRARGYSAASTPSRTPRTPPGEGTASTPARSRTAHGATRSAVLAALTGGGALTATEVAQKAGLARPTVSTTLTKLVKSGEVEKAERGYRVADAGTATAPPAQSGPARRSRRAARKPPLSAGAATSDTADSDTPEKTPPSGASAPPAAAETDAPASPRRRHRRSAARTPSATGTDTAPVTASGQQADALGPPETNRASDGTAPESKAPLRTAPRRPSRASAAATVPPASPGDATASQDESAITSIEESSPAPVAESE